MPHKPDDPSRDAAWLLDMLTAAKAVCEFVAERTFKQYEQDLFFRSAVERQVEIIREAARGISEAFKAAHPQIAWRPSMPIMAQRHRLVHEYGEVDDRLIWTVATVHVPTLVAQLTLLIPPLHDD